MSNEDFNSNSRSGYRSKRKKTNLVLNSLIIIILLLIVFVAYTIFSSGGNKASSKKENPITAEKMSQKNSKEKKANVKNDPSTDPSSDQSTNQSSDQSSNPSNGQQQSAEASTPATVDQSQAVVTKGDSSSNVQKSIQNPAWKGVGTSQTGTHTPTYETDSVDWQEMLNAISYATGLEQSNMIVQFLGRDRTTDNASVGTVYSKDKQQKYKVYIQWVDGEGWKPTKVEEISK